MPSESLEQVLCRGSAFMADVVITDAEGPEPPEGGSALTAETTQAIADGGEDLEILIARIWLNQGALNANIFAIGRDLHAAKAKFRVTKTFTVWVKETFSWSPSTAHRYMRAWNVWGENAEFVSSLEASSIYLLTAKNTPPRVRVRVERALEDGQRPSTQEIREWVQAAKAEETEGEEEPQGKVRAWKAAALIIQHLGDAAPQLRMLMKGADRAELCKTLTEAPAYADVL